MKGSERFSLNSAEIQKILRNAFVFLAPAIAAGLAVLTISVQAHITDPGTIGILSVVTMYVLNFATDWLRKFIADNSKKVM